MEIFLIHYTLSYGKTPFNVTILFFFHQQYIFKKIIKALIFSTSDLSTVV